MELPDYLPVSMLNAFAYCPRRFWIEFVNAEMEINAHVLEGQIKHERAHTSGIQHEGAEATARRVYVYSDQLRVTGFADLIEIEQGRVTPVEYKKGVLGKWLNDHFQLCAQALCLEERLASGGHLFADVQLPVAPIEFGFVFYFGSRRRERVELTDTLRAQTRECIAQMWTVLTENQMPAPLEKFAKCRECSLEPICLPREVRQLVG
ncbi:MAG: CRISPR-associated protein Cas4 [Chloroflexi bacterium]|nr:CRISPR-associated protein Cas4 [Chloroflexota bacterium]